MAELRKDSKERAGKNIMQVSDIMEKLDSKANFQEARKLACQCTPLAMAAVHTRIRSCAHGFCRTKPVRQTSKNEWKVGHHIIGDPVMWLRCTECSKPMDKPYNCRISLVHK